MTYEKFLSGLESLGFTIPIVPPEPEVKPRSFYRGSYSTGIGLYGHEYYTIKPWEQEPSLILTWSTGGISGGSCWGGENHAYSSGEPEPQWDDLDRILEHFCPNISFIRYKGIMRLTKTDSYSIDEYYGNSRDYAMRVLKLTDLWQSLNDNKLFEADNE